LQSWYSWQGSDGTCGSIEIGIRDTFLVKEQQGFLCNPAWRFINNLDMKTRFAAIEKA